eukprot:TRINITY_DN2686_c0_g1_i3.p1 TRINITY_DN2686_c0_g1~~TRINITY_DN2686_c0_g1_i3.p1  ORF type:complete len:390 (-),score=63.43 TRINITY_DN2686_c0_g1_i3:190-1359(-)
MIALADVAKVTDKVEYLVDAEWGDRMESKLRKWLSDLIGAGSLLPVSGEATLKSSMIGSVEGTHARQKPMPSLQDVIAHGKADAGEEFYFMLKNIPVHWVLSELLLVLREAKIEQIGGLEMSASGPGSAKVRVRSKIEADRCLALNGLLLPHAMGFFPVEVQALSSPAPLPLVEAIRPQADLAASDVCMEEVAPVQAAAFCVRGSGTHRTGAGSKTRAGPPAERTTDPSFGAHRKAAGSKTMGPEWQRKGATKQEGDGLVVAVFDEKEPVHVGEGAVTRHSSGFDSDVLAGKIREQVEHYFCDPNWQHDEFLQKAAEQGEGGFVPIRVLMTCNQFRCLTTDAFVVASALCGSNVVQVSEDGTGVRARLQDDHNRLRKSPLEASRGKNQV